MLPRLEGGCSLMKHSIKIGSIRKTTFLKKYKLTTHYYLMLKIENPNAWDAIYKVILLNDSASKVELTRFFSESWLRSNTKEIKCKTKQTVQP
jgi:hypothetical protein